jgi:nucleoside-diphosphate-sugar epimerase
VTNQTYNSERFIMKIVVIGGRGLIGSKVASKLSAQGHDVIPTSRRSGVDSLTGEGLANAIAGADVLVDVADSPLFDDEPSYVADNGAEHRVPLAQAWAMSLDLALRKLVDRAGHARSPVHVPEGAATSETRQDFPRQPAPRRN